MTSPATTQSPRHKVVVIGSGFGGLFGTKALRRADVDVTVIAKTTHHLFQPLLYQVATGILSEGEIAPPTREVLSSQDNASVILGEVTDIDLAAKTVTSQVLGRDTVTSYDSLLVATWKSRGWKRWCVVFAMTVTSTSALRSALVPNRPPKPDPITTTL